MKLKSHSLRLACLLILPVIWMAASGSAKLLEIPLHDLVQNADAGVIGRLTNVKKTAGWGVVYGSGTIEVSEVLFGRAFPGNRIPIQWIIQPQVVGDGDLDHFNSSQLWLLEVEDGVALHTPWQSILDTSRKSEVLAAGRNPLRARQVRDEGTTTYALHLIFRNETSVTIQVPSIEVQNKRVIVPTGTKLEAITDISYLWSEPDAVQASSDAVKFTSAPQMLALEPGQSHQVAVKFFDLFHMQGDYFSFRWSVPGLGQSNTTFVRPLQEEDDHLYNESPFWLNVIILLSYSPTRELFAGLLVGGIAVWIYYTTRHKRNVGAKN